MAQSSYGMLADRLLRSGWLTSREPVAWHFPLVVDTSLQVPLVGNMRLQSGQSVRTHARLQPLKETRASLRIVLGLQMALYLRPGVPMGLFAYGTPRRSNGSTCSRTSIIFLAIPSSASHQMAAGLLQDAKILIASFGISPWAHCTGNSVEVTSIMPCSIRRAHYSLPHLRTQQFEFGLCKQETYFQRWRDIQDGYGMCRSPRMAAK